MLSRQKSALLLLLGLYLWAAVGANAQTIDFTSESGSQLDQNVLRVLDPSPSPSPPPIMAYSEYLLGPQKKKTPIANFFAQFTPAQVLTQEIFNEKNSLIGLGITDTYTHQIGVDIASSSFGTDIQPFLIYQHVSRDLLGKTTYRADAYGGLLNLTQSLYTFPSAPRRTDDESKALNLAPPAQPSGDVADAKPDNIALGLNFSSTNADVANLKKGSWSYHSQNSNSIATGPIFNLYLKCSKMENPCSLLPSSITISPTYTDQIINGNNATSASNGMLTLTDRNNYVWIFKSQDGTRAAAADSQDITLTESNYFLHDTNEEPLMTNVPPIAYQNWAKFGLALAYRKKDHFTAKVEYIYEAFNAQYAAQNVTATLSINF